MKYKMAPIHTDIVLAKQLLEQGEIVAIPTETVYGLAANAYNEVAVAKIFKVKQRPASNPLIVHIGSIQQISDFVEEIPMQAKKLAAHYWPGPLTLLLPKKPIISNLVTAGTKNVAIRIPNHPITLELLKKISFPLAAPSANPFGYISPTTPEHVQEQLGNAIPYILTGGSCEIGIESTIIGFDKEKTIVHRLGAVSVELIEKIVGPTLMANKNIVPHASIKGLITPGSFLQHYAPRKPLKLGNVEELIATYKHQKIGILGFDKFYGGIAQSQQILLTPNGNLAEAAKNLFAALRKLDQLSVEIILCNYVPNIGLGMAINDRLTRASAIE